jgi:FtsZ-interacting cell division protein ZipA
MRQRYEWIRELKLTDLQLALLAVGVVIILAIALFNWWQERKLRADVSQPFETTQQDALMEEFRIDPEAILKDEPAIHQRSEPDEDKVTDIAKPVFEPTIPMEPMPREEIVNPTLNEVNLALEEFEQDMAEPYQETEPEVYADETSRVTEEMATTDELAEEAGLDVAIAPESNFEPTQPGAPIINSEKLPASVNQQIDLIALLYLPEPVTGTALREFLLLLADIDKPVFANGLGSDDMWHLLAEDQGKVKFTRAAYSLQLADRAGFVSKTSLNRFQQATDSVANKLGAQVEWQGSGDPWLFASELDGFCAEVDKMVGFHLVSGSDSPFTGTKFKGLAEANGLTLNKDGEFHYESKPGTGAESTTAQKLFSVVNQDSNPFNAEMLRNSVISGISFQLDIPRVMNCIEVFNQMVLVARQMESSLGANLVDDKGRPLGETQIEKIRQQLRVIHAKMVTRGVVPGSDSALRLFA